MYSGVCVGGPIDGQSIVSHSPTYYVAVLPEFPMLFCEKAEPTNKKVDYARVEYTHRAFPSKDGRGEPLQFWVTDEMRDWQLTRILRKHLRGG